MNATFASAGADFPESGCAVVFGGQLLMVDGGHTA